VTGFGLKLRMSPFNAIVAKHSLYKFPKLIKERHKSLNYFNEQLKQINFIEPVYIAPYAYMGAWYGFKPLFVSKNCNNLSKVQIIKILQAEGIEVSDPSGPVLSTQPLYFEEQSAMFDSLVKKPNIISDTPNAVFVEKNALSFPTFSNFNKDKKIIDQYIKAMKKVQENIKEI
jgi:dTDP-4-amino-4,6-dideoxygalactose transaminase